MKIDQTVQEVREKELWKYCEQPFKSETAFIAHFQHVAGKSTRTLWGMIGLQKALPGTTAEVRRAIGPRKGAKIAKAAKVAKKKGRQIPQSIIDAASRESEPELDKRIADEGLTDERPASVAPPTLDMFPAEVRPIAEGEDFRADEQPMSSDDFQATPQEGIVYSVRPEAIYAAIAIYDPEMTKGQAAEFVCTQWLLSVCEKEGFEDMTNRQAAAEIAAKKGGKKKKTKAGTE